MSARDSARLESGGTSAGGESPDRAGAVVELVVPARQRFLATVRLTAASVATDLGFSVDDLDELRIAIDESLNVLMAAQPPDAAIRVTFTLEPRVTGMPGRLRVDGAPSPASATPAAPAVDALVTHILGAVTDAFELNADGFVLVKKASDAAD
jgi:anti-sigma regulatory factor (Ser/Thr protein kinase)